MMIGRWDVIIPTKSKGAALKAAVHAVQELWPRAVTKDIGTGEMQPDDLTKCEEIFVYREPRFVKKWAELGTVPELSNTMVHMLIDAKELTAVVDDPDESEMQKMLAAIRAAVAKLKPARKLRARV
jgi:hypothetical protein